MHDFILHFRKIFFVTFPEKIPLAKNSSEILQRNNSLCADGRGETQ
jgi:hypothetical protein